MSKLLNAPEGADTSWKGLRGNVVVLEFWGTYCAPCVSNIPAMNKLESAFESEPVVFIHVTDEDENTVRTFLEHTPMRGWIGIDKQRQTFKNFGIKGLPRIAVVNKDARLQGWTVPFILVNEPDILRDVLTKGSSEKLSESPTWGSAADPLDGIARDNSETQGTRNLCDIVIRRSTPDSAGREGGADGRGDWNFDAPLRGYIASFCGLPEARVITEVPLPEEHFDMIALNDKGATPAVKEAMCRLIAATFDLSITREKRAMDVYVLKALPDKKPALTRSLGGVYSEGGIYAPTKEIFERMKKGETFFFAMCPVAWLADSLSHELSEPVVAELGTLPEEYNEVYTICFPYEKGNLASLTKGLEEHVGFTLTREEREIDMLVVRRAERQQSPSAGP